jgi:cell surface protein SprA
MGQDIINNYYEILIPLRITRPAGPNIPTDSIWPSQNSLDFALDELVKLKDRRNAQPGATPTQYYSETINGRIYAIYGNPNLGEVRSIFVGVQNPERPDGPNIGAEVWINELRLSQIDEETGWAATGRVDIQLADLGTLSVAASHRSIGFGTIEQRANERSREATSQFDASLQIDLGKLLPREARLSIPTYGSLSKMVISPEYDPYDLDTKLKQKLSNCDNCDSIKRTAREDHSTQTFNVTNMKMLPKNGQKNRFYNISNFDLTYNFLRTHVTSPIITEDLVKRHRLVLGYGFTAQPKYWEPFKKMIKSSSPWLTFVKDFNLNYTPSVVGVRVDMNRQFGRYVPRIVNTFDNKVERVDSTYDKYFHMNRAYTLRWDLTKSLNIDFQALNKSWVDEPSGEIDTKNKKDSIRKNFWDGGRNTSYDQTAIFTYNVPTQKFPFLDWMNVRASYGAKYRWMASSLLMQNLNQGNIIENGSDRLLNGELDFTKLYSKSKWLAALENQPAPKPKEAKTDSLGNKTKKKATKTKTTKASKQSKLASDSAKAKTDSSITKKQLRKQRKLERQERRKQKQLDKQNRTVEVTGAARIAGKIATMVKRASVNYGEVYYSRLPGYTDSARFMGNNFKSNAPGLGYIFGKTPDTSFLNDFASRNLVTKNAEFNQLFAQGYDQKFNIMMQLEPFREFNIDLNLDKSYTKSYTELFKDTTGSSGHNHLSPYVSGGFSVTYIAFQTLFEKFDPNQTSQMFKNFEAYRQQLSLRVANQNEYWKQNGSQVGADGYAVGYNRYAQEVLIPSFLAAYTKKSPDEVALIENNNPNIKSNPFKGIKAKPNWRVNFTGLTQLPALQEKFTSINITHSYQGRLSMNSFTSALLFQDPLLIGQPSFIDTISGNYIPYFLVPNITISEGFEPIIGVDFTTTSQWNARFEYRRSRQLSLSLLDYQLSEVASTEIIFGTSYRKRGMRMPFSIKLPKWLNKEGGSELENDITFRFDFSIRDDATSNSRLDQNTSFSTAGQKVIRINPSIDYVMSNRVNIRLFFDQMRSIPYISTAAPTTNTRAGVQLRVSLAQ